MTHEIISDVEDAVTEAKSGLIELQSGTVDELPANISELDDRLDSISRELSYAKDAVEEAVDFKDEYDNYFSGDDPMEVHDELAEWRENTGVYDCYEIGDIVAEFEQWRELGDVDEVTEKLDALCFGEDIGELKAEVERQAALIARLATALDEINTITADELIGTGGE